MRAQRALFAILVGGLVLTVLTISSAQVDTRRIEEVVKKNVLTPEDLQRVREQVSQLALQSLRGE